MVHPLLLTQDSFAPPNLPNPWLLWASHTPSRWLLWFNHHPSHIILMANSPFLTFDSHSYSSLLLPSITHDSYGIIIISHTIIMPHPPSLTHEYYAPPNIPQTRLFLMHIQLVSKFDFLIYIWLIESWCVKRKCWLLNWSDVFKCCCYNDIPSPLPLQLHLSVIALTNRLRC